MSQNEILIAVVVPKEPWTLHRSIQRSSGRTRVGRSCKCLAIIFIVVPKLVRTGGRTVDEMRRKQQQQQLSIRKEEWRRNVFYKSWVEGATTVDAELYIDWTI